MKLCYKAFFILVTLLLTPLSGYSNSANIFDSSSVESNVNVLQTDKGIPPNSQVIIPSLNYKDADIRDILKSIALEYQTNIAIDNQINKRITISLFDLRVYDAVKIIAEDNHFDFKHDSLRFTISMKNLIANNEKSNSQCEISVIKDMLNMNLRNVSIEQFVSTLHQKTQKNILISNGVHGNLSGRLSNVTFEKGLTHILNNNGFKLTEVDSFYYIAKIQNDDINNSDNLRIADSKVSISNGRVSLNISEGKLDNILDELSNKLNLQMIKLIVPEEEVTIKCREIDIETAIDYLFRGTEYSYKIENGVYIIGEKKSNKLNLTRLIKLKYLRAEDLVIPSNLAADLISSVSKEHNGIVVTGAMEDLLKIIEYIESIDIPVPQVMIEALVIDYNLDNIYQFGLSAGNGDPAAGAKPDKFFPGLDVTVSGSRINKVLKDIGSVNIFGKDHNISKLGNLSDDFYINLKAMEEE
ncbi:MAG: hypothetical protein HND52_14895, partial [Ignavibacteriae bacterium]|nr:hypothetical protein [Ignavibacteriota bacterium]NOG99241.1 hypothetical protein [Ignavibacteriota bacterium]